MKARSFVSTDRFPDLIRFFGPSGELSASRPAEGKWSGTGFQFEAIPSSEGLRLVLESDAKVSRVQLRWRGDLRDVKRWLGDAWERSYADLEWRAVVPERVMPWYCMANDGERTHGFGVETGAAALCFWTADPEGICLWADVRSGGVPAELGSRSLAVATVRCREGLEGESAFEATRALCRLLSRSPRLPDHAVFGANDWNFAYGNSSAELLASMASVMGELAPTDARPYVVVDEGWAMGPYEGRFGHGPWIGNPKFGDMGEFSERLQGLGVRPGLWYRPLTPLPDSFDSWKLARDQSYLDPSVPEVLDHVEEHIARFVGWGYEMIKHDFSTFDFLGKWGFQMGASPASDGWRPRDASRTSAEILSQLYARIRRAAGSALLIGCNTIGHLAVGSHELQRTGDDTSGVSWNRNRRMGVNTLAFRAAQQGTFFDVDPDMATLTGSMPWDLVSQWLELVAESGTSLFVAFEPDKLDEPRRKALARALKIASERPEVGEPLDWFETTCPRRWNLCGRQREFAWMGASGAWPFGD